MINQTDLHERISSLSPVDLRLLAKLSRNGQTSDDEIPTSTNMGGPVSPAQERLWFVEQLHPESSAYHLPLTLDIDSSIDIQLIQNTVKELSMRHEALRTRLSVESGQLWQWVDEEPLECHILQVEDSISITKKNNEIIAQPFDFKNRLTRCSLVVSKDQISLVLVIHHILADGWSMQILMRDFFTLLTAGIQCKQAELPAPSVRPCDLASWQRRELNSPRLQQSFEFWNSLLNNAPTVTTLPTDRPRPRMEERSGASLNLRWGEEIVDPLDALARSLKTTRFSILIASFAGFITSLSGESDHVIGTPFANRERSELQEIVAFLVEMLPMRIKARPEISLHSLAKQVADEMAQIVNHTQIPLQELVSKQVQTRSLAISPLFQIVFAYQDLANERHAPLPSIMNEIGEDSEAKFELCLSLRSAGSSALDVNWEYRRGLFDLETIRNWANDFTNFVKIWYQNPHCSLLKVLEQLCPVQQKPAEFQLPSIEMNANKIYFSRDSNSINLAEVASSKTRNDDAELLLAVTRAFRDEAIKNKALNGLTGNTLRASSQAWIKRLNIPEGARISSCDDLEARILAASLVVACNGHWTDIEDDSAYLAVVRPWSICDPNITRLSIGWNLDHQTSLEKTNHYGTWPLSSGFFWCVEIQALNDHPNWPTATLLSPSSEFQFTIEMNGHLVPHGGIGELNVLNPLSNQIKKQRPLVRQTSGGRIQLLAPNKNVKVRGFHSWPDVLEDWLKQQPALASVNCSYENEELQITLPENSSIDGTSLERIIGNQLGEPFRPKVIYAHQVVSGNKGQAEGEYDDVSDAVTAIVWRTWREVLVNPELGLDDNFFEAGGSSIRALDMLARQEAQLGVTTPLYTIFEAPTVRKMAATIREQSSNKVFHNENNVESSLEITIQTLHPDDVIPWCQTLTQVQISSALQSLLGGVTFDCSQTAEREILERVVNAIVNGGRLVPASLQQSRLWFAEQLQPNTSAQHLPLTLIFPEAIDKSALQLAFRTLVNRHQALRTRFSMIHGELWQDVLSEMDIAFETSTMNLDASVSLASEPFNLETGPLVRGHLFTDHNQCLLLVFHHAIVDGWSIRLLRQELFNAYQQALSGSSIDIGPLPKQAPDFALEQYRQLKDGTYEKVVNSWVKFINQLDTEGLAWPTDRARPMTSSQLATASSWMINADTVTGLKELAAREQVSLFQVLSAGIGILSRRLTNRKTLLIGSPIADRSSAAVQDVIAYLVDVLPVVVDFRNATTIPEVLQELKRINKELLPVPFTLLARALGQAGLRHKHAVIQTAISLQESILLDGINESEVADGTTTPCFSIFDLDITFVQLADGRMRMVMASSDDLFQKKTVSMLANQLRHVLSTISTNKGSLDDLPLLQMPYVAKDVRKILHSKVGLHDRLREHAKAGLHVNDHLTYAELLERVAQFKQKIATNETVSCANTEDAIAMVAAAETGNVSLYLNDGNLTTTKDSTIVTTADLWVQAACSLAQLLSWEPKSLQNAPSGIPIFELSGNLAVAWAGASLKKEKSEQLEGLERMIISGPRWDQPESALFLESCGGFAGMLTCREKGELIWIPRKGLSITIDHNRESQSFGKIGKLMISTATRNQPTGMQGWINEDGIHISSLSDSAEITSDGIWDPLLLSYYCSGLVGIQKVEVKGHTVTCKVDVGWKLSRKTIYEKICSELGFVYHSATVQLDGETTIETISVMAPSTVLELAVARQWQNVLNVECHDIDQNFFEAGGASIEAVKLLALLKERLNLSLDLSAFFAAPTVRSIANHYLGRKDEKENSEQSNENQRPPIRPNPSLRNGPLSFAQEQMWFMTQLFPKTTVHNMGMMVSFESTIPLQQLEKGLQKLVERHSVLRSIIVSVGGIPMQILQDIQALSLQTTIGSSFDVKQRMDELMNEPIDLQKATWRGEWIATENGGHTFIMIIHHIICDGWSVQVLERDLKALCSTSKTDLQSLPISYADYSRWQRTWLSGGQGSIAVALQETKDRLKHVPLLLDLPLDYSRPQTPSHAGSTQQLGIDTSLRKQVTEFAHELGVTPFAVSLAAFAIVLNRWSGQENIVLGTPSHQRNTVSGISDIVGLFVNTLVLNVPIDLEADFRTTVKNAACDLQAALTHEELPFEHVVSALKVPRDITYNPLFQVMIAWQDFGTQIAGPVEYDDPIRTIAPTSSYFDFTLYIHPSEAGYLCVLEYSTSIIKHQTASRLLLQFRHLLDEATRNPNKEVKALSLSPAIGTIREPSHFAKAPSLQVRLAQMAISYPSAPALQEGDKVLNYAELITEASELASALYKSGARPYDRVAVSLPAGIDSSISFLACLWIGACYVPIDVSYPEDRREYIFKDAKPKAIICYETPTWIHSDFPSISPNSRYEIIQPIETPFEAELYVIYTSGSTGKPKGVILPQAALLTLCDWQIERDSFVNLRTAQFSPIGFDVSIQEHLVTWLAGGCLVIIDPQIRKDPTALVEYLRASRVQRLFLPYVALQQLCTTIGQRKLPDLQEVVTAGEQLRITPTIRSFFNMHKQARLFNQYGPSETHVVTEYVLPADTESWPFLPPIGSMVAGAVVAIVDDFGSIAPPGILGEIWVRGQALALGYVDLEQETAARFVLGKDGHRWYRTGDYGRSDENGIISYTGRRDQQLKIRGFRVEIGEIEAALCQISGISEAVVINRRVNNIEQLVAYICPKSAPDSNLIRKELSNQLTDYMIPSHIIRLEDLPKTSSGKLARTQLPEPIDESHSQLSAYTVDRELTPLEDCVARLWSQVLGVHVSSPNADFFELGGQSLFVTQFIVELEAAMGFHAPLTLLFGQSSLEKFVAAFIDHICDELGELGPSLIKQVKGEDHVVT